MIPNRCRLGPVPYESNESVWCLTTERGTLVTRRNGKVAVVGNCGRGFRLHPGKENCLILDYGGNVLRHGPVDQVTAKTVLGGNGMAPAKECPECHSVIAAGYARCPDCGHEFPPLEKQRHEAKATTAGIISGEEIVEERDVQDVLYSVHVKRGAPENHPRTLRVDYQVGFNEFISEWVCPEHTGYARWKFEKWWRMRSDVPPPATADEAAALASDGLLALTHSITVRTVVGEQFGTIIRHVLGDKPRIPGWDDELVQQPAGNSLGVADDDIPF